MEQEGHRGGSQEQGSLLHSGRDRLDAVRGSVARSHRSARHEAGGSGPLQARSKKSEADLKADLKAKYWQPLTDGIEDEKKALQIDPEYENAMAYMNLLIRTARFWTIRRKQYDADIKEADDWVQKSLETTKKKAKKKAEPPSRPQ